MDGRGVRDLVRRATAATLATLDAGTGHPYASLVEIACLPDARPVLLLSGLARHTRNLLADPRASLLVDDRGAGADLLASGRATLVGTLVPSPDPAASRRYLARYPDAAAFAALGDFAFWVLAVDHAHVIAGFGRIARVPAADILATDENTRAIAIQETELIASVNDRLAVHKRGIRLVGIDAEGLDVRWPHLQRVPWSGTLESPENLARTIICSCDAGPGRAASGNPP